MGESLTATTGCSVGSATVRPKEKSAVPAQKLIKTAKQISTGIMLYQTWPLLLGGVIIGGCGPSGDEKPDAAVKNDASLEDVVNVDALPSDVSACEGFEQSFTLEKALVDLNMSLQRGEARFEASVNVSGTVESGPLLLSLMFDNPQPFENSAFLYPDGFPLTAEDTHPMAKDCEVGEGFADYLGYCSYKGLTTTGNIEDSSVDPNGEPIFGTPIFVRSNGEWVTEHTYLDVSDYVNPVQKTLRLSVDKTTGRVDCGDDGLCDESDQVVLGPGEELTFENVPFAFYRTNADGTLIDELPVQISMGLENVEDRCWELARVSDGSGVIDANRLISEAFPQFGYSEPMGENGLQSEGVKLKNIVITIIDKTGTVEPETIRIPNLEVTSNSQGIPSYEIPARFYENKDVDLEVKIAGEAQRLSGGALFPDFVYGGGLRLEIKSPCY
ncbi:MAG: hypothetical protein ABIB65_02150 [Candidatus Margulisiibacteriota bacterium]